MKKAKQESLAMVKRSRPRPKVTNRPAVFESRKAYKRNREKATARKEIYD